MDFSFYSRMHTRYLYEVATRMVTIINFTSRSIFLVAFTLLIGTQKMDVNQPTAMSSLANGIARYSWPHAHIFASRTPAKITFSLEEVQRFCSPTVSHNPLGSMHSVPFFPMVRSPWAGHSATPATGLKWSELCFCCVLAVFCCASKLNLDV